jgi:hypothetical protein
MKPFFTLTNACPWRDTRTGEVFDDRAFIVTAKVNQITMNAMGQTFVDLGESAAVVAESLDEAGRLYAEACNG